MAEVAKASHELRLMAAMIPSDVAARITKAEMADRLNFASQLVRQAAGASNRVLAEGYRSVAKAALAAEPRDEVMRRHAELMAKANAMPPGEQRDALQRQAQQLLDANPPAPTAEERARASGPVNAGGTDKLGSIEGERNTQPGRQVVKAARLVGVWNQQRRLTGVVDPARIRQRVVKAAKGKTEPQMQAVFDADGNLVGIVDPADITPVSGSGASTAAAKPAADAGDSAGVDQVAKAMLEGWRASRAGAAAARSSRPRPGGKPRR